MKIRILLVLMPTLVATLAGGFISASDTSPESSSVKYCPKKYKTAIMSYGTYSSPLSSDRKVIIQTQDGTPVGEKIFSPNGRFDAYADLGGKTTTIDETVMNGKYGRSYKYWSMDGCFEMLGLSDNGRYLVTGRRGDNLLPQDYDLDETALRFFDKNQMIREIPLNQLISDPAVLLPVENGYYWGDYLGLNSAGYYVVKTVEGRMIMFDVTTGLIVELEPVAPLSGWNGYRDIMRGFEYQYPDICRHHEDLNFENRPTGRTSLRNESTGWGLSLMVEDRLRSTGASEAQKVTFEESVIERIRRMCEADGCDSRHYAGEIISLESFVNPHDLQCFKLYLQGIEETYYEGEENTTVIDTLGPFYAVRISGTDKPYHALVIKYLGWEQKASPEDAIIEDIVNTVSRLEWK